MAENQTTAGQPLPDPYADQAPGDVLAGDSTTKNPWASSQPPAPVQDPAVRLEPPPDPFADFGRGQPGEKASNAGPNEMLLAGMGRIMDQQRQILELLKGGAKF